MKITEFIIGQIATNTYVVNDEGSTDAYIIDPAAESEELIAYLHNMVLEPRMIILTHAHGDHIGGIPSLIKEYPSLEVAVGKNDKNLLHDAKNNFSEMITGTKVELEKVKLLSEGDIIKIGKKELRVIETPGHTKGGICLYTPGILFSGDTLFKASIGRTDLPGGDYGAIIKSIREKLFSLPDDTVVYPGHMQETTIGFEKTHNMYAGV